MLHFAVLGTAFAVSLDASSSIARTFDPCKELPPAFVSLAIPFGSLSLSTVKFLCGQGGTTIFQMDERTCVACSALVPCVKCAEWKMLLVAMFCHSDTTPS